MYQLISARNPENTQLLGSMHNLRFRMFKERMGWVKGDAISRMEFDQYDTEHAVYLVKIDPQDNQVSACSRLIKTTYPYLLADTFRHFIDGEPIRREDCYETSRFVADLDKKQPANITGELIAAMIEFGTYIGMRNYVSLSDIRIEKILLRSGWDPQPLGSVGATANEASIAFKYTVSSEMLENVRRKSGVSKNLITNLSEFCHEYIFDVESKAA